MKLTDKQRKELLNRFTGSGVIILKRDSQTITVADFHFGKNGHFYHGNKELHKCLSDLTLEIANNIELES